MAGAVGFEPTNGGSKGRCLTAWRRPIERMVRTRRNSVVGLQKDGVIGFSWQFSNGRLPFLGEAPNFNLNDYPFRSTLRFPSY